MSLGPLRSLARRLSASEFLFAAAGVLFLAGVILPYFFSTGLPVNYDLATHYHMGYRLQRGLWDPTWSGGVTTIDYPPGALLLASEFTSMLISLVNPYLSFKIFYFLVFFASIGAVYFLSKTFDPSSTRAAASLFLAATAPAITRAFFAGWLTVMTAFVFMTLGYSFFHRFRKERRAVLGFMAGLLFALASVAHPYGILVSLLLVVPVFIYDALGNRFSQLQLVGNINRLRPYFSVFAGLTLAAPALLPFFVFVQATGSEAPIPHFSRNGTILDVSNFNIIQPLGPFLIIVLVLASALFFSRFRWRIFHPHDSGLTPYLAFCAILLWIGAAPQGGLDGVLPFANWLVYDVFIMFFLSFAVVFASGFLRNVLGTGFPRLGKRRITKAIALVAIVTIPIGFLPLVPPPFGLSLGSTYNLPTDLSAYLSKEVAQGQWGRLLALGASANIYDLPEINNIPLMDNNYPTGRLENFLRSSGVDDFNTAKNYPNGTRVLQYALANYDLFGIKWILVADPFYDQYVSQGIFQITSFNYQENNPPVQARLYEALPLLTPFDGDINATYQGISQVSLQSNQQLYLSGSATSGSLQNITQSAIRLSITTTATGNGSGEVDLPLVQSGLTNGATLLLELRSENNSYFGAAYQNQSNNSVALASKYPLGPNWQWLRFSLSNATISSVTVGVVGNRTRESVDVGAVKLGYPAVRVTNTPNGISVDRDLTGASEIIIKQSFFPTWRSDSAQVYQANGGLIGLQIPQGVKTVNIYLDQTLFLLQFWYPNVLTIMSIVFAAVAFRKPIMNRLSRSARRNTLGTPEQTGPPKSPGTNPSVGDASA
ncbi:MAG: hypothetical protein AUJ07_10990 [Crenarchaeota archaeon 13_1_40CM_3_53_5]|nr:MAG: hypothetical protein AUJ07_10990 [Crenarchaeota archaeon 13_1_40CM_3_53_5]